MAALAVSYDSATQSVIEQLKIRPGGRCLEVGTGHGSMAVWLADQGLSVMAVDRETCHLPETPGITPFMCNVIDEPLPAGDYDLVHARFLLMHLPAAQAVLHKMHQSVALSGWLVVADADDAFCRTSPYEDSRRGSRRQLRHAVTRLRDPHPGQAQTDLR